MPQFKFIEKDGKRIKVPDPQTNVQKADKALKEANKAGAFDITKATPNVEDLSPVEVEPDVESTLSAAELERRDELDQQGVAEKPLKEKTKIGEKFELDTAPDTIGGIVEDFKGRQKKELAFTQQQLESKRILAEAEAARFGGQAEGAISAEKAKRAQGREGAVAGSAGAIVKEFTGEIGRRIEENKIRLQASQASRDKLLLDLEQAQRDQQDQLADNITKKLGAAKVEIDNAKTRLINSQNQNLSQVKSFLDILGDNALSDFTPDQAGDLFESIGAPRSIGAMVASAHKRLSEAQAGDNDLKTQQAKANLAKTLSEAKFAGLTTSQRDFIFAQDLTAVEKEKFLNFAGKNPSFGFTKVGNRIYSTNPLTGEVNQVAGVTGGGQKIAPSGKFETGKINGKNVTLDSNALFSLKSANGAAVAAGVGEINVSSSTRDQKQTINDMVARHNIGNPEDQIKFNDKNPNLAASELRARGKRVANVGMSNHETGLAIDIFPVDPASADDPHGVKYAAQMKQYLEAKGWKQSTDPSDSGHFNYVGQTIYSEEQEAVMNSINMKKYDGTDAKSLADADLTYSDLATHRSTQGLTPEQKAKADNVKVKTQIALDNIDKIFDKELWRAAGWVGGKFPAFWSMKPDDLQAALDNITSNLALDEMKALKEASPTGSTGFGAMNEKELTLLTSSKGTIRPNMSEEALKENLLQVKEVLQKAAGIEIEEKRRVITDNTEKKEIYTMLQGLQAEGESDEEMIRTLESKGIDASQFFK